jgi:hypothetical protein
MLRLCAILFSLLQANVPAGGADAVRAEPVVPGRAVAAAGPLAPLCTSLQVRVIAPQAAPPAGRPDDDCGDAMPAGRPGRLELVRGGHRLDVVWIVFPAKWHDALVRAFATRHGMPTLAVGFGPVYLAAGATARTASSPST